MRLYCIYDANTVCTTKNPYNKRSAHLGLTDIRELGYIRIDIHTQVLHFTINKNLKSVTSRGYSWWWLIGPPPILSEKKAILGEKKLS